MYYYCLKQRSILAVRVWPSAPKALRVLKVVCSQSPIGQVHDIVSGDRFSVNLENYWRSKLIIIDQNASLLAVFLNDRQTFALQLLRITLLIMSG